MRDPIITLDGKKVERDVGEEKVEKVPSICPLDYLDAICYTKTPLLDRDEHTVKQYVPFVINRALSYGVDTVIYANEMNSRPLLSKHAQFTYLTKSIRKRKRYNKWLKQQNVEHLALVMQTYRCNRKKALDILSILTPSQLDTLERQTFRGGRG